MVLAGGIALGAYEAGAYAALHDGGGPLPDWTLGSSIGAVTAAIIAGNAPEHRIARLRQFWQTVTTDPTPVASFWFGIPDAGAWRQAHNQASVLETLFLGRPGIFRPRLSPGPRLGAGDVSALYDLAPLRAQLLELIDFDRLNQGSVRLSLCTTDVVTGERVVFDTGRGMQVGPEHVVASCALLPLFAPVEIEGRLLGDGGLASNAPLDLVLDDPASDGSLCFVIDLFAPEGSRPHTLGASLSRAGDLAFGNQSRRLLEAQEREQRLRAVIGHLGKTLPPELRGDPAIAAMLAEGRLRRTEMHYLAYRAGLDEAGFAKVFDFSRATLADRWRAGEEAMQAVLQTLGPTNQGQAAGVSIPGNLTS
jgi:NTE family protein